MNWTGGRLHRHSNKNQNAVTKNPKKGSQRFRSSITKDSNWVPFSYFPSPVVAEGWKEEQVKRDRAQDSAQSSSARLSHLQSPHNGSTPLESSQQSQPASRLDHIKHQLLHTRDWASVAVAKPLEVEFTRTDEIERFGKRRKLTDDDRKRLADAENNVSWTEWPFRKAGGGRDTPSEMRMIKEINIRINGRDIPMGSLPVEENSLQTNTSSQSMLLGRDWSSTSRKSDTAKVVEGAVFDHSYKELDIRSQPPSCLMSPRGSVGTESSSRDGSLDTVEEAFFDEGVPRLERRLSQTTQKDSSANDCQTLLSRRRFTIDDQIDQMIAENKRRLNATNRVIATSHESNRELYNDSILSPRTLKEECYTRRATHYPEENLWSSGAGFNAKDLSLFVDMQQARNEPAYREKDISVLFEQREADTFLPSTATFNTYTSPRKIFGQPVVLDDNEDCHGRRPIWNQDLRTTTLKGSARYIAQGFPTQSISPGVTTFDLLQGADSRNPTVVPSHTPKYNNCDALSFGKPRAVFHPPATLLEGSAMSNIPPDRTTNKRSHW